MKFRFILFSLLIIFLTNCNTVKKTAKIANKSGISNFSDDKKYIEIWKKKWTKIYSVETNEDFKIQSKTILSKQMDLLEEYIEFGNEDSAKNQSEYITLTINYVKSKVSNTDYLNTIDNLNDVYLQRAENLAKISKASQFAENKNYSSWQNKWNELSSGAISTDYQLDAFILQANKLLEKQMSNIKNYIEKGDETSSVSEKNSIKDNYDYVRTKIPNYDKRYNKIKDLNEDYLSKVPILAKMQHANIYQNEGNYNNWRKKWDEIEPYSISVEYLKTEFLKQARILLNKQMKQLQNYIKLADENNTYTLKNSIQENYDFTRKKYPKFDNEYNNIPNLNDYYINSSVNLAKISRANIFIRKHDYNSWVDKWSQIGNDITEQYLIDSFENQSVIVFPTLYQEVLDAKKINNCSLWEQKSELLVNILKKTQLIYKGFDNYCLTQPKLNNINQDQIVRLNRDSKICIAEAFLNDKNYNSWIDKWIEIENKHFLDDFEINIFNTDCQNAFGSLLNDISNRIEEGNYSQTQNLTDLTIQLSQSAVLTVNPNYEPQYYDLNETYLYNAKFFANAQKQYLSGKYKKSIEYLLQNCGDKLASDELKPKFLDFYNQTLQKLVDIYKISVQNINFDKQVSDLNLMNDIYNIKPDYLTITYVPNYLNENMDLKTFRSWLDWQLNSTISNFFDHADSLISQKLYTLAYDFIFERAGKLPQTEETQKEINNYNNLFETEGTDYYKSEINKKIYKNKYVIAKQILDDDLLKINSDFKTDRTSEYNQIINNIRNKGTKYYISQRDQMIANQNWDQYCHKYCDSISMINPSYNIQQCNDEIDFEKDYYQAENYYKNGLYFCAIDLANRLLRYRVTDTRKTKARTLITNCKNEAIITVGTIVTNNDIGDDLNTFIDSKLQDYKNNYVYKDYLEIIKSSNSNFTINLSITDFNFESAWDKTEAKYACIVLTRQDQRTKTDTDLVKKTVNVGDFTYYVVKNSQGTQYKIRYVNGNYYYLTAEGSLALVYFSWNYVYDKVPRVVTYQVTQYFYEKVAYLAKYGHEKMDFKVNTFIKDNSGGYIKYSKEQNFTYQKSYSKFEKKGDYNVNDLVQCPDGILDTWIDTRYNCSSFDKSDFNSPSDPFKGKTDFYENFLKNNIRNFITQQIPEMMKFVKEKHNKMKCD